jgi:hypothetical protein
MIAMIAISISKISSFFFFFFKELVKFLGLLLKFRSDKDSNFFIIIIILICSHKGRERKNLNL